MTYISRIILGAFAALLLSVSVANAKCNARFLNPITEVCWDCISRSRLALCR